jgi:hypothetical protein
MRNITSTIDAETMTEIVQITGHTAFYEAVGYLSMWNMSFPYVHIQAGIYDGAPEITATYRREDRGLIGYQIAAVWHDDHFGFHS